MKFYIIFICASILIILIYGMIGGEKQMQSYRTRHHCVVIGEHFASNLGHPVDDWQCDNGPKEDGDMFGKD